MAATCTWTGKSGHRYTYYVHSIGTAMKNEKGNYIYAWLGKTGWVPVYIGQGNLKDRSDLDSHHKGGCIKLNGATHFHAHLSASERVREAEEQDLLANYSTPCNG